MDTFQRNHLCRWLTGRGGRRGHVEWTHLNRQWRRYQRKAAEADAAMLNGHYIFLALARSSFCRGGRRGHVEWTLSQRLRRFRDRGIAAEADAAMLNGHQ